MENDPISSFDPEKFLFRGLHPSVCLGTASDRYRGWLGQIYTEELYRGRTSARTSRVGKRIFRDEVLPIDCVREYFQHFPVLEIDYTFYSPLIDKGVPTPCARTLREYFQHMGPGDRIFLKAPQMFFVRKAWRGKDYVSNETFLNPEAFVLQFYAPALELLGDRLKGIVFEQEYQRQAERANPVEFARELDLFFSALPGDSRYHVELRTEAFICRPVMDVLQKHGIGQVLSHWTWLPNLKRQLAKAGGGFIAAGESVLIRLMTPLGTRYEDAYARAFPFDRIVAEMLQPEMISVTADLMCEAVRQGKEVNVIINNRSGGNAPLIARQLALEFSAKVVS